TEIHGDLMWRQIIRARTGDLRTLGNLVILDLDEHTVGHAGKDVADLCAANRFIAEDLPCRDRDFARSLAEDLNKSIVIRYLANVERIGARWDKGLRSVVPVYLAFRHLHDAAYHLPIWQGATDPAVKERHKRYVDFSIAWFRKSIQKLEKILA
ncbi:MAG: hypothetical protein QMD00_04600, partial [Hadesarchaea archaeon]|nr:hypothetical protein [Hadesarchaea archaeon]